MRRLSSSIKQFQVSNATVNTLRNRAIDALGAQKEREAAVLAASLIAQWRDLLPLEGRCQKSTRPPRVLERSLLATLKAAAGYSAREEALVLGCPQSTIEGRRRWVLKKLESTSIEQAITKALDLGVISPEEPSVELALCACKQLAEGDLAKQLGVGKPTKLQLQCLELLRQGLSQPEIAKRRKVSQVAVNSALHRLWKALGADSFKTALERVQEIGLPAANPEEPREEEIQDDWPQSK